VIQEPSLGDTKAQSGGVRREQPIRFGIRPMVLRPGLSLRHGLAEGRIEVGGEVTDLPAKIHDGGHGQAGEDGWILLHLG